MLEADNARKSKKKKKDKSRDSDRRESCLKDIQSDISTAVGDSSAKKKKRKHPDDVVNSEAVCENDDKQANVANKDTSQQSGQMQNFSNDVQHNTSVGADDSVVKSVTKKKKQKHQESVLDVEVNNVQSVCESGDQDADNQTENGLKEVHPCISSAANDSATKSIAKKKKKKHQENVVDTEVNIAPSVCENDAEDSAHKDKKSAKKRKHRDDVNGSFDGTDAVIAGGDLCKQVKTADGRDFTIAYCCYLITASIIMAAFHMHLE